MFLFVIVSLIILSLLVFFEAVFSCSLHSFSFHCLSFLKKEEEVEAWSAHYQIASWRQ